VRKTDEWVVWGNVRVVKTERKSGENAKGERKRERDRQRKRQKNWTCKIRQKKTPIADAKGNLQNSSMHFSILG